MHAIEIVQLNECDTRRLLAPALADWLTLLRRMKRLSWDVMDEASSLFDTAVLRPPHLVAHYLVARLNDELRAVSSLTTGGLVIQALSLDAGMLEFAFTIGWVGKRIERANKWLKWEKDQYIPHGDVLTAINATYANGGKTDAKAKANAKVEMAHYTKLCQIKHGNPKEREQFGIDMDEVGRPARFAVDELSPAFIDASRMALWYAIRYLWLGTCCYNDFHAAEAHHDVRAAQLTDLRMTIESTRQADEMRMLTRI